MNAARLSPTMQAAVALAQANGGSLRYHLGGWWAGDDFRPGGGAPWANRQTVNALLERGRMRFTEWGTTYGGASYPTRAELLP